MGLYNDLSPAPSYSGRAETMEGNGTETNIYSIAPSLANDAHCSHTNTRSNSAAFYSMWHQSLYKCCNSSKFVGSVPYMFNSM